MKVKLSNMSAELVREAALYLEYFLKGLSECNVVGSYTVQFMELRSFNVRLEASLADHLKCLVVNMKGLLMKLDSHFIPFCSTGVQTEGTILCSLCSSQNAVCSSPKIDSKKSFEEIEDEKSYDPPEIDQLLTSTPLIQLKKEMPILNASTSRSIPYSRKEDIANIIHIESSDMKDTFSLMEPGTDPDVKMEKCSVALSLTALDDGLNIDYPTTQMEEAHGEILLDERDGSDSPHSDGMMYSIYTMNSCGVLQLVSRVFSKNNVLKDGQNEPVEKAMIEINNLKEEISSIDNPETLTSHEDDDQYHEISNEESLHSANDSTGSQEKPPFKNASKSEMSPWVKQIIKVEGLDSCSPKFSEIVKLGLEDLGNSTWCDVCEKEFPSVGSLKAHISRTHSKVKWCNTCTKFITSEDMSSHVQNFHREIPYICNICGQSLRTNGAFQRHMDIHKGLRGSACEVCGQTFSRTEYYREHIRIHRGEKPFKCPTCEKTFTRSSNLYAHMRIHNGDEQRHICKLCLKSFARADKLKEHAIRHLKIKRFSCRLCPKSYRERRDLVKHLGKIHASDRKTVTD